MTDDNDDGGDSILHPISKQCWDLNICLILIYSVAVCCANNQVSCIEHSVLSIQQHRAFHKTYLYYIMHISFTIKLPPNINRDALLNKKWLDENFDSKTASEAKLFVRRASSQITTITRAMDIILDAAFHADCGDINHFHSPSYYNVHHYN